MRVSRPYLINFIFRQDADFHFVYRLKNADGSLIDVSGWVVEMQIRETANSDVLATLSTETGHITLGGAAGTITIDYPSESIATLTWASARYDIRETPPGGRTSYRLEGGVSVKKQVTRG